MLEFVLAIFGIAALAGSILTLLAAKKWENSAREFTASAKTFMYSARRYKRSAESYAKYTHKLHKRGMELKDDNAEKVAKVIEMIMDRQQTDGDHHKEWYINELLLTLCTEEEYEKLVGGYEQYVDDFPKGIAP